MNLYISWFDWQRTTTGLEWASLVGNTGRISSSIAVGATSLSVVPMLTVAINQWDVITIFDGSSSETVVAAASANVGATNISVAPTVFAHSAGTCYCTDGAGGSLADQITKASQQVETICKQALFLTTYTSETLAMPTMRASIDNHAALHFRPRHWPVQSLTNLAITVVPGNTINYDPSQVIIDSDKQMCTMPNMQPLPLSGSGQAPYPIWNVMSREQSGQLTLTYSAGYSTIPSDVAEAAVLLTSELLAQRLNPMGAFEQQMGKRSFQIGPRMDTSGESIFMKRARQILQNYSSSEAF